jgi:hypothetical protein
MMYSAALRQRREMSDLYKKCADTHKTRHRVRPSVDRRLGTRERASPAVAVTGD